MSPLAAWPTMPDAPNEIIKPTSTESPLNASVCAPGMYGYAIATANTQTAIVAMRFVGSSDSRAHAIGHASQLHVDEAQQSPQQPQQQNEYGSSNGCPHTRPEHRARVAGFAGLLDRALQSAGGFVGHGQHGILAELSDVVM